MRLATEGGEGPAFVVPALLRGESVDRAIGIRSTGNGDARLDLAVIPETTGALVGDLATGLSLTVDRCRNGARATPPQAIALVDRLIAGDCADFQVRVAVPAMPPDATAPCRAGGAVSFKLRATGLSSNLAGTPVIRAPPPPVVATATATGTALSTATATASPTATLSPYGGTALAFDRLVDAMQVGWTEAVGLLSGQSVWTFEAWVNPVDLSVARVIHAEAGATSDALVIRVAPGTSGATRLEVGLRHGGAIEWSGATVASGTMAVGTWAHVAVVFDAGTTHRLATNGATVATLTKTAATTGPDVVPVISWVARPGDAVDGAPFVGVIDEVRAWSHARTYDGFDTTRAQRLLGIEDGLILHYPMGASAANGSDAKGMTLVDQSPSKVVGTLSGGVRWVASRAPVD